MFLTFLVVKMSSFNCQKNPWGKSICFAKSFDLNTYLRFSKFETFLHVFDLFGCHNVCFFALLINHYVNLIATTYCKIPWTFSIMTCFWLIWSSKFHLSFARKTLEANQFVSSRASIWIPICILQNLRHFDMFLTYLVVKMSFFICQKNPWGKSICFVESFDLSTYLHFAKFEAFWHVFDIP